MAVALLAACGGGDGNQRGKAPDLKKILTATLPADLPEVRILGESSVSTAGRRTYTIRTGDTFSAVAERFGVTLEDLIAANPGVDPGGLHDGDVINLPETAGAPAPAPTEGPTDTPAPEEEVPTEAPVEEVPTDTPVPPPPTEAPPAETPTSQSIGATYIVEPGDSMASIAQRFGYSVESLIEANPGVDPNNLTPGQVIILP